MEADPLARELEALLMKTRGLRMDARVSTFMRPDPPTLPVGATLADAIEVMVIASTAYRLWTIGVPWWGS